MDEVFGQMEADFTVGDVDRHHLDNRASGGEVEGSGAFLVRPDKHVAWRATTLVENS